VLPEGEARKTGIVEEEVVTEEVRSVHTLGLAAVVLQAWVHGAHSIGSSGSGLLRSLQRS
jgi:hypothetical protein